MKSGRVNISEVHTGYQNRLKPNVYLIEGKRIFANLKKNNVLEGTLNDIVDDIFRPGIFKRIFVNKPEHGMPYLTAQAMMTEFPLLSSKCLSTKLTDNLESMILKNHSILVSCAGTVGNIKLIDKQIANTVGSQDIIRVIPKDNFGFAYAYLASKQVFSYLQSQIYGSVVPRIEPENVAELPLFKFDIDIVSKVEKLMRDSIALRENASCLLNDATESIEKYISYDFENHPFKCGKVNSQDIFHSLRMRIDPPALMNDGVVAISEVTKKFSYKRIGELNFTVRRPGIFKRIKVENGIPYIKGSEIFLTNPFRRCEHLSKSKTPFIDEMELKNGQILVTCAGSVGNIKMITKEYEDKKAIGSQDIIRIDSPAEDDFHTDNLFCKEYLFAYLQLPFVYSYMQSMKYGSVIERIEPFHVESIPVVEPTPELSVKVKNLIRSYMDDSYKAFCLEEEAITLVEKEIEKWNN